MPFIVEPQPGEQVYLVRETSDYRGIPFAMAVSNQAIYLPAQKFALKKDPWYFKRVELSEVEKVSLVRQRTVGVYLFSAIMIVFGAVTSYLIMAQAFEPGGRATGWPLAILVAGIVLPFVVRGRRILVVKMRKGKYKWKPELVLDKKTRDKYSNMQAEILTACRMAGIQVIEETDAVR